MARLPPVGYANAINSVQKPIANAAAREPEVSRDETDSKLCEQILHDVTARLKNSVDRKTSALVGWALPALST